MSEQSKDRPEERPKGRWKGWLKELAFGVLVFAIAYAGLQLFQRERQRGCSGGNLEATGPAPDFDLPTLASGGSERVSLASLKGKPVLLTFWATWCGACRSELPDIQALHDRADGRFHVLTVSNENPRVLAPFVKQRALSLPVLVDAGGRVGHGYKVDAYPTSVLIDAAGQLVHDFSGTVFTDVVEDRLIELVP